MNRFLATAINCFYVIECALGYYSNIFGKWYLNCITRVYCIFIIFFTIYGSSVFGQRLQMYYFYTMMLFLFDYLFCSFASFYTGNQELHKIIRMSLQLESRIAVAQMRGTDFIIFYGLIALIMEKMYYLWSFLKQVIDAELVEMEQLKTVCLFWSVYKMGQLFNSLGRSIPFQLTYNGIKSLRLSFESKMVGNSCSATDKIATINEHAHIYLALLENLNATGLVFKIMNFRDLTFSMYYALMITVGITFNKNRQVNMNTVVETMSLMTVFIVPCILLELTKNEVEKMKNTLIETYRSSEDDTLRDKIMDMVKFMELRPFEFTVWRLYSIDVRLSLVFLNLMSTYILVALQFTHLFD